MKKVLIFSLFTFIALLAINTQTKAQAYVSVTSFYGTKEAESTYSSCGYMANLHISFNAKWCYEYEIEKSASYTGPYTAIGGQIVTPSNTITSYSFTWQDYNFCSSAYYRIKFKFQDGSHLYSGSGGIYVAY